MSKVGDPGSRRSTSASGTAFPLPLLPQRAIIQSACFKRAQGPLETTNEKHTTTSRPLTTQLEAAVCNSLHEIHWLPEKVPRTVKRCPKSTITSHSTHGFEEDLRKIDLSSNNQLVSAGSTGRYAIYDKSHHGLPVVKPAGHRCRQEWSHRLRGVHPGESCMCSCQ